MPKKSLQSVIDDILKTFIFHAVASHFVNGLVPIAVLFLGLTLVTANIYFDHTVFHLFIMTALAIPFVLFSGIHDWRVKFHGGKAPIFYRKIKLGITLAILCTIIIALRMNYPDPIAVGGWVAGLYIACIALTLPVVTILGHLGGKLAFMVRQQKSPEKSE